MHNNSSWHRQQENSVQLRLLLKAREQADIQKIAEEHGSSYCYRDPYYLITLFRRISFTKLHEFLIAIFFLLLLWWLRFSLPLYSLAKHLSCHCRSLFLQKPDRWLKLNMIHRYCLLC